MKHVAARGDILACQFKVTLFRHDKEMCGSEEVMNEKENRSPGVKASGILAGVEDQSFEILLLT